MRTFGLISAWIIIAAVICGLSSLDGYSMVVSIEGILLQLLIPLMSLNMMVCSSTANSLFKYEEQHEVDKNSISNIIVEMKQSIVAQFIGIALIIFIKCISFIFSMCILSFVYHTISISVLVMFVWLVFDIALAYFRIIKGQSN